MVIRDAETLREPPNRRHMEAREAKEEDKGPWHSKKEQRSWWRSQNSTSANEDVDQGKHVGSRSGVDSVKVKMGQAGLKLKHQQSGLVSQPVCFIISASFSYLFTSYLSSLPSFLPFFPFGQVSCKLWLNVYRAYEWREKED